MSSIKNIIFDLGGVVIDLKRENAVEALERLGIKDVNSLLGEYEQKGPFLQLEKGEITDADVYDYFLKLTRPGTTATDIRDAFETFLVKLPVERLRIIKELREKGYKTFVLSNTNPIMFNHWIQMAFMQDGLTINDYFDGVVTSFQELTCKPDPEIFRKLVKRYNLDPSETLMLDDSEKNCEAAKSIGLQSRRIKTEGEDSFNSVCKELLATSL